MNESPTAKGSTREVISRYINCYLLREHAIVKEDLWVRGGKILDPKKVFYNEKIDADVVVDCKNNLIAPGYIELQINGAFGVDFSYDIENIEEVVAKVAKGLLAYGVTSFCPTVVTSPPSVYHKVISRIPKHDGGPEGAGVLGLHLEGPFISKEKKGAHPENCIIEELNGSGLATLEEVYGKDFYKNTAIITMAPELPGALEVTKELTTKYGVTVSIGHSVGTLKNGERSVRAGANFITHLFNAMLPFHHRDPGLVGLLTSWKLPEQCSVFYGMIADGIHTHPATMRIAHRTHSKGLVLVSDAIVAAGLASGTYNFGQMVIEVDGLKAYVAGTKTLAGSVALLDQCVKTFYEATECSKVEALEAATLHPAQLLGIDNQKGTLKFGTDADFLILDDEFKVLRTYIAGTCVYDNPNSDLLK